MSRLEGWRSCPRCAATLRNDGARVECEACGFVEYANSAPAVQALVVDAGRVLLTRRAFDPGAGKWDLPGGFLDEGEHPLDGLRRELREETGLEVELGAFLGAWLDPYEHRTVLGLTWLAIPVSGTPRPADDVAALDWFGPDELPRDDEFAFGSHPRLLALWREQRCTETYADGCGPLRGTAAPES